MNIRPAKLSDIEILKRFEQGVVSAERPFAQNLKQGPVQYYDLETLIESRSSQLLVGEIDNRIVACGYARIENSAAYVTPDCYAYLGFMYVEPEYRGQQLIGEIVFELLSWSNERGIEAFKLDVYSRNESAVRAYEKFGFEANLLQMWKKTSD